MKTKKPNRPKRAKKAAVGRTFYHDRNNRWILAPVESVFRDPVPVLVLDLSDPALHAQVVLAGQRALLPYGGGHSMILSECQVTAFLEQVFGWPSPSVSANREKSGVGK